MSASAPPRLPFSQLWVEEEAYLREAADGLPEGAVVVDLGTAQGGSAYLLAQGSPRRGRRVFSYDPTPSAEAFENTAGLPVELVAETSLAGAARWRETCGRPIDLLFVDASHTLENVYRDYHAWLRWLAPGARVLFHDYDRPERGGVSHLGVRVLGDALRAAGRLRDVDHVGRILAGRIQDSRRGRLPVDACARAWRTIGRGLSILRPGRLAGFEVLGRREGRGELLAFLLGLEDATWHTALGPGPAPEQLLVFERPLSEAATRLVADRGRDVLLLDDLRFGYALERALRQRRDGLLARTSDRGAFFKWEEYLEMLDHGTGRPPLASVFDAEGVGLRELSRRCARELLRQAFLERLAAAIVGEPSASALSAPSASPPRPRRR